MFAKAKSREWKKGWKSLLSLSSLSSIDSSFVRPLSITIQFRRTIDADERQINEKQFSLPRRERMFKAGHISVLLSPTANTCRILNPVVLMSIAEILMISEENEGDNARIDCREHVDVVSLLGRQDLEEKNCSILKQMMRRLCWIPALLLLFYSFRFFLLTWILRRHSVTWMTRSLL